MGPISSFFFTSPPGPSTQQQQLTAGHPRQCLGAAIGRANVNDQRRSGSLPSLKAWLKSSDSMVILPQNGQKTEQTELSFSNLREELAKKRIPIVYQCCFPAWLFSTWVICRQTHLHHQILQRLPRICRKMCAAFDCKSRCHKRQQGCRSFCAIELWKKACWAENLWLLGKRLIDADFCQ